MLYCMQSAASGSKYVLPKLDGWLQNAVQTFSVLIDLDLRMQEATLFDFNVCHLISVSG